MNSDFYARLESMKPIAPRTIALAAATDVCALKSVVVAHQMGFVNAILCGNKDDIELIARENNLDISDFEILT